MDFITSAYAQSTSAGPLQNFGEWMFFVAGLVLGFLGLKLIWKRFDVSSGQVLILAIALALAALPYIANFEWSKDGFKFTTRGESLDLAKQVEELTRSDTQSRQQVLRLTETLESATKRIAALERASGASPDPSISTGFDPSIFSTLKQQTQSAIERNDLRLNEIGAIQKSLQAPLN